MCALALHMAHPGTWFWIHSSVHPAAVPPGKTDVCVSVCVSLLSSAGWSGPWLSVYTPFSWLNRTPGTEWAHVSSPVPILTVS